MKLLITLTATLLLATLSSPAQAPLQNAMFTAATSAEDSQGDDWAFLLFQLTADLETLLGRRLAVYQKPGGIDDPGAFTHTGNVALTDNPAVIKVLLTRAEAIGQPAGNLNAAIDELFGDLIPDPAIPVEEKLAAVIRGSIGDERNFTNLMLLARMHPGVSLALGLAHAGKIPNGTTTFEIRETNFDGAELGVVGRVTVTAKAPVVLTAPHPPVNVPELSPMGHLNARLRWGMPDDLRRLALLQYGYNVYAVDKSFAEVFNWHNTPPAVGILATAESAFPQIRRINRAPVIPTAIFNEIEAADLAADPKTFFAADDGGLVTDNPTPYKDGDRVYYFIAARDVLGRDGFYSEGTEVVLLDRVPPNAPRRPEVSNVVDYQNNTEDHRLQVRWRQVEPTEEDPISGYFIYRWENPTDAQKFGADPTQNLISGFIPHVPGETRLTYIDNNDATSPSAPADHDKTFWYTVRAFKPTDNEVGGVFSPNSAPAFGVLRNRFAPEAPDGQIFITCCKPDVAPDRIQDVADGSAADPLRAIFEPACIRKSSSIAWAEFALNDERDDDAIIGRFHFQPAQKQVRTRLDLGRSLYESQFVKIFCRVGDYKGNTSQWVELEERDVPQVGFIRRFIFEADTDCQEVELTDAAIQDGCFAHSPGGLDLPDLQLAPQDGDKPVNPIKIKFGLKDRAREYRVYRRLDEGDMTLWRQGLADEAEAEEIILEDGALPPNAGEVAYFGQYLDDNGNASELKLLGKHVALAQPAPQPMLNPLAVAGDDDNPMMQIRWFSPPHGVERFAVVLFTDLGPLPDQLIGILSNNTASPFDKATLVPNGPVYAFGAYRTPSLESGFGPGPDYEVTVPVEKGRKYVVRIYAIAKSGGPATGSVSQEFQWPTESIAEATGPNVPWPARPLPVTFSSAEISPDLVPIRVSEPGFNGVGLVIGEIPRARVVAHGEELGNQFINPFDDPRSFLFPDSLGNDHRLLPMVVYRRQVPSEQYPAPSGDLIQVTPMMTEIATAPVGGNRFVRDPFVKIVVPQTGPANMILLDTQPAVMFAQYEYHIVTYNEDGEIRATYTTPALEVTPTPK